MTDFDKRVFKHEDSISRNRSRLRYFGFVGGVIAFFILFMIIISFIRKANAGNPITFTGFLNWLGSINSFQINTSILDFTIKDSWGIFDGFRNFLNIFTTTFGLIVFIATNLINLLSFITQFILYIFV